MRKIFRYGYLEAGAHSRALALAHVNCLPFNAGGYCIERRPSRFFSRHCDYLPARLVREVVLQQVDQLIQIYKFGFSPGVEAFALPGFVRSVMQLFDEHQQLELDWYAVADLKIDDPTAHVILMPTDLKGSPVRFQASDYVELNSIVEKFTIAQQVKLKSS